MDQINLQFKEQFDSLPKDLQDLILTADIKGVTEHIAQNYSLNQDQSDHLYTETYLTLLCLEPLLDYINNLIEGGIEEEKAINIAKEMNEQIFKKVSDSLREVNTEEATTEDEVEDNKNEQSNISVPISMPQKEDILAGIEMPENISENKISVSSLTSNKDVVTALTEDTIPKDEQIEIRREIAPEIAPVANAIPTPKVDEMKSKNLLNNFPKSIMEAKLKGETIVQKQETVLEDASKLPKKNDPYRENIV